MNLPDYIISFLISFLQQYFKTSFLKKEHNPLIFFHKIYNVFWNYHFFIHRINYNLRITSNTNFEIFNHENDLLKTFRKT